MLSDDYTSEQQERASPGLGIVMGMPNAKLYRIEAALRLIARRASEHAIGLTVWPAALARDEVIGGGLGVAERGVAVKTTACELNHQ